MDINNILSSFEPSPKEILLAVAQRVKQRRLDMNLTQKGLALKAGLTVASYRRFETTGEISFHGLVMLGIALNETDGFGALFPSRAYASMDDLLDSSRSKPRKKGSNNG